MINLILLNLPVILSVAIIAQSYFSYLGALDRVLCSAILYFSYIIAVQLLLGSFGILTLSNLLLINAA